LNRPVDFWLDAYQGEHVILCLFLDTDDQRFFPNEARSAIREVCEATEPEVRALLPNLTPAMELAALTGTAAHVIPETGEIGTALNPNRVRWTVDPLRPGGVAATARAQLRSTLFHEFHHCVRGWVFAGGAPPTSFMDGVVSEGLATAFERDAAGRRPPWGQYSQEAAGWVVELLRLPLTAPYDEWMFRHPDGRRWIGYRAGTYIADRAIAASGLSAAQLVLVPTDEILKMAGIASVPAKGPHVHEG
jgi:hypothetical protein